MKLNGFTKEQLKVGGGLPMPLLIIINYVATALAAFAIAMFIGAGYVVWYFCRFYDCHFLDGNQSA